MKVALYARVSTRDKDQNPENQLIQLRKFCADADWQIVNEYVDFASAKDYKNRKQWHLLQKDARMRKFKVVVVFRLDRAFRSVRECTNLIDEWYSRGISFKSLREDSIDTTTSQGRFIMQIMASMAELETAILSERVSAGMARSKAEGNRMGRKPLDIDSQTICEALHEYRNVRVASEELSCSIPYIYKILMPLGINPSKVARHKDNGHRGRIRDEG